MRHLVKVSCCVLFFGALLLPLVQLASGLVPRIRVEGVALPSYPAPLTAASIGRGEFQTGFELWFSRQNGLWEYLVRLDNQVNWKLFSQASSSYVSQVLLGKGITLFQRLYLDDFNRMLELPDETLQHRVVLLKAAQQTLARRGIPMLLVLSPNHLSVNPAILREGYLSPNRESRPGIYERMKPMLDQAEIDYVDGLEFFREEFRQGRLHFVPSASHWDGVGACLTTQQILDRLRQLTGLNLARLGCEPVVTRDLPRHAELDLLKVANFWDTEPYLIPTRYPRLEMLRDATTHKANLLFVGTSFLYQVLEILEQRGAVRRTDFFYYYSEHRRFPGGRQTPLDPNKLDWSTFLQERDAVIIECSTAVMSQAGFHFIVDVVERLQ